MSTLNIDQLKELYMNLKNKNQSRRIDSESNTLDTNINSNINNSSNRVDIDPNNKVIVKEIRPGNNESSCPNGGVMIKNNEVEMTLCVANNNNNNIINSNSNGEKYFSPIGDTNANATANVDYNMTVRPGYGGIEPNGLNLRSVIDNNIGHNINIPPMATVPIKTTDFLFVPAERRHDTNPQSIIALQSLFPGANSPYPSNYNYNPSQQFQQQQHPQQQPPINENQNWSIPQYQPQQIPTVPPVPPLGPMSLPTQISPPASNLAGGNLSGSNGSGCHSCAKRNSCACKDKLRGCDYCRSGGRRPGCPNCHKFYNNVLFR